MVRPDSVRSSVAIKSEATQDTAVEVDSSSHNASTNDDDDPIVREIDVYISQELSHTLHLLQFPIQPAASPHESKFKTEPLDAKFRPQHRMLELQYPIPNHAKSVPDRPLPDTVCLSSRTFTSSHISPVTHMALAKLNKDGSRLNIVPLQQGILQMRPSFQHLHMHDDAEDEMAAESSEGNSQKKAVTFQKKENERAALQRKNSYAYKRSSEESEEWISLEVHGDIRKGRWGEVKKEYMDKVKCQNQGRDLKLSSGTASNEGYVKSLNYLDTMTAGSSFTSPMSEDLSEWKPSNASDMIDEFEAIETKSSPVGETEKNASELAAKLVVLLQNGNGTMIPYRVIRSRLNVDLISDEVLTMALSSCAVLVRGNFCLKSSLCQFVNFGGSGSAKAKAMRELRDLVLLLLNMHGEVQRERLIEVYKENAFVSPDTITILLETVAKRSDSRNCWISKVEDDDSFATKFAEIVALHAVYWMKKKASMTKLVKTYESVLDDMV